MAEMTRDYLSQRFSGAQFRLFNDGVKAMEQTGFIPDVIILDYQLDTFNPGALNGMQVLMQLKKKFSAPVICLSAQEKPEVSANLIKAGAYDYVVKNQQAFNKMESSIARILNQKPEVKRNNLKDRVIAGLILIIIVLAVYILVNKI
jgi:DNA-binding response OmpR family regulator